LAEEDGVVDLAEEGTEDFEGALFAEPGVALGRAVTPVVRGAGFTGAFLFTPSSTLGGTISEIISSSLGGTSALGVWMGDTGLSSIIGALMGVLGVTSLTGVFSISSGTADATGTSSVTSSAAE
jgi:hypothetical protein